MLANEVEVGLWALCFEWQWGVKVNNMRIVDINVDVVNIIGELAPLLSVLGTKCISTTNLCLAESPDLDPVAMHYLVLFLISFCSVSASSQLVKPS